MRCTDPVLWAHPRFGGKFPQAFDGLEIRNMPDVGAEVDVRQATKTDLLQNLGFVEKK